MKHRKSKQRSEIIKILSKKNYHPTADEIYTTLRKKLGNVSLATVYRNVELLSRMNEIVKIKTDEGPARYDGNTEPHYHAVCEKCGLVKDVPVKKEISEIVDMDSAIKDFTVTEYYVRFKGFCNSCRDKMQDKKSQ
ncbi:MAG: transcriptional repressor [bacterium]